MFCLNPPIRGSIGTSMLMRRLSKKSLNPPIRGSIDYVRYRELIPGLWSLNPPIRGSIVHPNKVMFSHIWSQSPYKGFNRKKKTWKLTMRTRLNPPIRGSIAKSYENAYLKLFRLSQSPYKGFNSSGVRTVRCDVSAIEPLIGGLIPIWLNYDSYHFSLLNPL